MDEAAHQEMEVQWALSIRGECICLMKMHREHVYNENSGHGLREINIANKRAALVLISLGESGKIDRQITSPQPPTLSMENLGAWDFFSTCGTQPPASLYFC